MPRCCDKLMRRFFKLQGGRRPPVAGDPTTPEPPSHKNDTTASEPELRGAKVDPGPQAGPTPDDGAKLDSPAEKTATPAAPALLNDITGAADTHNATQETPGTVYDIPSTGPNTRIFALVIAVDKYSSPTIKDLSGCARDGADFVEFLMKTLHVPRARIVTLTDAAATREQILTKFYSHFINNPDIERGDAIVFFYAGHGDRRKAPPKWVADDNKVETICPHDEGTTDARGKSIIGIPDWTFDSLMRRLAYEKGDNILAIFDCCHSGGVTRGVTGTPRALDPDESRGPIPEDLDQDIRSWCPPDGSRDAAMVVPKGFSYPAMRSHVLLAACRQDEKAQENRVVVSTDGGLTRGMFTYHLLSYLRSAYEEKEPLRQLTYARLLDRLLSPKAIELCGIPLEGQHPLCEGLNRDRLLFSTAELAGEASSFAMRYEDGRLYVAAGRIHGVEKGAQFVVQAPGHRLDGSVVIVDHVSDLECTVETVDGANDLDYGSARAVVVNWKSEPMKVKTSVPVPSHGQQLRYATVGPKEYFDVSLDTTTGSLILGRYDPLAFWYGYARQTFALGKLSLPPSEVLEVVALWNFHLYRFNGIESGSELDVLQPVVEVHRVEAQAGPGRLRPLLQRSEGPNGANLIPDSAGVIPSHPLSTYKLPGAIKEARIYDMKPYYGITLTNNSEYDLYPYVFYFDPSTCAIKAWYLPPGNQVRAPLSRRNANGEPGRLSIGYGAGGADSIKFSLPPAEAQRDTGFLKIFVSTSYVDMRSIRQKGIMDGEGRGADQVDLPFTDTWVSAVYALTSCRHSVPT